MIVPVRAHDQNAMGEHGERGRESEQELNWKVPMNGWVSQVRFPDDRKHDRCKMFVAA
jgi:hypothetical protein